MTHKECIEKGFTSSIEFVKIIELNQADEVKILFKELCSDCHEEIGNEIQRFKHDYTEEI